MFPVTWLYAYIYIIIAISLHSSSIMTEILNVEEQKITHTGWSLSFHSVLHSLPRWPKYSLEHQMSATGNYPTNAPFPSMSATFDKNDVGRCPANSSSCLHLTSILFFSHWFSFDFVHHVFLHLYLSLFVFTSFSFFYMLVSLMSSSSSYVSISNCIFLPPCPAHHFPLPLYLPLSSPLWLSSLTSFFLKLFLPSWYSLLLHCAPFPSLPICNPTEQQLAHSWTEAWWECLHPYLMAEWQEGIGLFQNPLSDYLSDPLLSMLVPIVCPCLHIHGL